MNDRTWVNSVFHKTLEYSNITPISYRRKKDGAIVKAYTFNTTYAKTPTNQFEDDEIFQMALEQETIEKLERL